MTAREAAKMLGVSEAFIYRMLNRGELTRQHSHPLHRKHARLAIPRSQVEALLPKPEDLARLPKPPTS